MRVVEFQGVVKTFGNTQALSDVSFEVNAGEIVTLLGPSGCGKTTSLRLIAGFEVPDRGRILISGRDVARSRPYERNIGLVFQEYALFPHMTVEQNLAYGMKRRGASREEILKRVDEMLNLVRLTEHKTRYPSQLSGGQQQRVALARALATRPEVMLLDEPLSALDAKLRDELRSELKSILKSVNSTTILVTHDQQEAMSLSDRIIVMKDGTIMQEGAASFLYSHPANRFVAEFLGNSTWFSGRLDRKINDSVRMLTTDCGIKLKVEAPQDTVAASHDVCIRRERITVHPRDHVQSASSTDPEVNLLEAVVRDSFQLGANIDVHVELGHGQIAVASERNIGQPLWQPGTPVVLKFRSCDCIVLPRREDRSAIEPTKGEFP